METTHNRTWNLQHCNPTIKGIKDYLERDAMNYALIYTYVKTTSDLYVWGSIKLNYQTLENLINQFEKKFNTTVSNDDLFEQLV